MKILKKQEAREIAIDHLSYIDSKDVIELYGKCSVGSYSFLVMDTAISLDNAL